MNRSLIIGLWISFAISIFDLSAGLMMASGSCFAAWIDAIRLKERE